MRFIYSLSCVLIISSVSLKVGETRAGVPLQLVPFEESSHAVRLVPNTAELNEFIDRTLDSVRQTAELNSSDTLPLDHVYKHFTYQTSKNTSVSGVFQTGRGVLWNATHLVRLENAYIYNNEEDSIQVMTKLKLNSLTVKYEQYNVTCGELNKIGSIDGIINVNSVNVIITLRVRQDDSQPVIFVCDGKVDELSLTPADFNFTLTGLGGYQEIHSLAFNWLSDHFNTNVVPHLQRFLTSSLESVVRMDEHLCYSLVLCNTCDFYAADF